MSEKVAFRLVVVLLGLFAFAKRSSSSANYINSGEFASTNGTQFVVKGRPFYPNGFNAYWLMNTAMEAEGREKVSASLQMASELGLNLVRSWAFSDGGYRSLQSSPGCYHEDAFQGLDFVVAEARKYGIRLILSLVNNDENFGGRRQYVQWATDLQGQHLASDDDFYTNDVVRNFYKNHVKTVLTRMNTITGEAYKDDPTIFAWELINEPRCPTDLSGKVLQEWISVMAGYVKSLDSNHLLEIGLEGFYRETMPSWRKQFNPTGTGGVGTDFISNNQIPAIDFATIHAYPDQWIPGSEEEYQLSFLRRWIGSHIEDASAVLKKPLVIAEFGKSSELVGYTYSAAGKQRDALYSTVYDAVYESARNGGPCSGGLFWQLLLPQGMDGLRDGYEIIFSESPSTASIIAQHSRRILGLHNNRYSDAAVMR